MSESIPWAMGPEKVSTTDAVVTTAVAPPAGETSVNVVGVEFAGALLSLQAIVKSAVLKTKRPVICVRIDMIDTPSNNDVFRAGD